MMVLVSSFTAAVIIFIISVLIKTNPFKIKKQQLLFSAMAGFLNPFIYYLILLNAYDILPAQSAQALNYTWGITLSIMSFFFLGHKPIKKDYIAIVICYLGVFTIASKGKFDFIEQSNIKGVGFALLSTIIWALYWILNTKDNLQPSIRLFWNFIFGFIYSGFYILITKTFTFSTKGFAGAIYIGIFEMGISFFLWLLAMKTTSNASRISNLIYLSPIFSLFIINYFLEEKIMLSTIIGLFCILCGIFIQNYKRNKN